MSRPKVKSKGLPTRVFKRYGSYYYITPVDRKWIKLGRTESEMFQNLAKLIQESSICNINAVIREWRTDSDGLLDKSLRIQHDWTLMLPRITAFFGTAPPRQIKPKHIRAFMRFDKHIIKGTESALGRVSANRHVEVLSTILTWAIQEGHLDTNPCREVKRNRERHRTYLPTKEEFIAAQARANPYLAVLMDFAYVSGARRGDLVTLKQSNLTDDGVLYVPGKTKDSDGRPRLIPWTTSVRTVIDRTLALKRNSGRISPYLFIGPRSLKWTRNGLDSALQRLNAPFHFHDIRAMAATEHEDIRDAQVLLAHSGEATTAIYRRGIVRVKPVDLVDK